MSMDRALRHMAWANQRVFAAVSALPDEALGAYIVNPEWVAGRILHHIVSGATWYVHCLGIAQWREIVPARTMRDLDVLADQLAGFDAQILSAVSLPDERLTFEDEDGQGSVLRSTLLVQAVHHATEHRAQLIDALESRGYSPISLDDIDLWAFEAMERSQPHKD